MDDSSYVMMVSTDPESSMVKEESDIMESPSYIEIKNEPMSPISSNVLCEESVEVTTSQAKRKEKPIEIDETSFKQIRVGTPYVSLNKRLFKEPVKEKALGVSIQEREWSRAAIRDLINAVKKRPHLYNRKDPLYFKKRARREGYDAVAREVKGVPGLTGLDCKTKFQSLRSHYGTEVRKKIESQESGTPYIYKPSVWWYPHLQFLLKHITSRKSNIPLSLVPDDEGGDIVGAGEELVQNCGDISDGGNEQKSVEEIRINDESSLLEYEGNSPPAVCSLFTTAENQTPEQSPSAVEVNTESVYVGRKKCKRKNEDDDDELIKTTNDLLTTLKTALEKETSCEEHHFGMFVAKEVAAIKNKEIRWETKAKILQIIMESRARDLENK